jgi:hypothetical protein
MRWKLIRRRLSISAPRMTVRSHLPWPLRWAAAALVFGFSAALALWAFELGKDLAGIDRSEHAELGRLRGELAQTRDQRDHAQAIANTAESLLKAERAAQERLADQVRQLEASNSGLKADLGFFERLLPASGVGEPLSVRGMQVDREAPTRWRYQLLLMQNGRQAQAFQGSYDLLFTGLLEGRPWSWSPPSGPNPLEVKQYMRIEGRAEVPPLAMVKSVQLRVMDGGGNLKVTQTVRF